MILLLQMINAEEAGTVQAASGVQTQVLLL